MGRMSPSLRWAALPARRSEKVFLLPHSWVNVPRCLLLAILLACCVSSYSENIKAERRRAEQILNLVSKDVQNNFYDDALKGLDWPALMEQARQRIRSAEELGQMHGAISALLYQLHDSHTVFIPPKRKIKAVCGFKAKPFAQFFWQPIGSWEGVEFGTEIAVSKVVMENGEELENRGVTPDEFCVPTPEDLRAERDPCLDRALAMARSAKN
jgi:C-terminal processing protease CtpA/Prc